MSIDFDILNFWFVEAGPKTWYKKSDAFDAEIRMKFENISIDLAAKASKGPHPWEGRIESSLALIIALDQFSRNMYRDTPAAFAWDSAANEASKRMIDKGWDLSLEQERRAFVYMPLMHSEDISDQNKCVKMMDQRIDDGNSLRHAKAHRELIERFGRFPHRNKILGRESTAAEISFLADGGYAP